MRIRVEFDFNEITGEITNMTSSTQRTIDFPRRWGEKAKDALARWLEFHSLAYTPENAQDIIKQFANQPKLFVSLADRAMRKKWGKLNENVPFEPEGRQSMAVSNQNTTLNSLASIMEEQRGRASRV